MKDYEMYDNDSLIGITNIYWENINDKYKNSIIKSSKDAIYKVMDITDIIKNYELEFTIETKDDLYDIVSKYIEEDKNRFKEIEKIKKYNNIKRIKKNQIIKLLISEQFLKKFNLTEKDIDLNSLINAKIYFINKSCESNKLEIIKTKLDKIVNNFKNIINSTEYTFYTEQEKINIQNKAIDMLNDLIVIIEDKTNYKFRKHFSIPLKIKCNK